MRHRYIIIGAIPYLYVCFPLQGIFGDVGAKYKNKYRSLVYNIKDVKNDGLFRRILLRDLSPIEVRSSSGLRMWIQCFLTPGYGIREEHPR
jgi:hypothetical protein